MRAESLVCLFIARLAELDRVLGGQFAVRGSRGETPAPIATPPLVVSEVAVVEAELLRDLLP